MTSVPDFNFQDHTAWVGGSFDPPHLGHVQAIQSLFKNPCVKNVLVIPSFGVPLKTAQTSFENRFEMSNLAFQEIQGIEVVDIEKRESIQYTWQLLEKTASSFSKTAFVMGTDQFLQLNRWARYPDVMTLSDWIVLFRKPKRDVALKEKIQQYIAAGWLVPTHHEHQFQIRGGSGKSKLLFVETEAVEVSSTAIRHDLALGKINSIKDKIPEKVLNYIERNHLYGT